jgi:hypothetical protein
MSKSNPNPKKLQVSALQLRRKLEEMADPALRRMNRQSAPRDSITNKPTEITPNINTEISAKTTVQATAKVPEVEEVGKHSVATPHAKSHNWFAYSFPSFLMILEVAGVALVGWVAMANLVAPELSMGATCQGKVTGKWQTRWGTVSFNEDNQGLVKGKFEYKNVDRGLVRGELSGRWQARALDFTWQETYANKSKQQGNGIFVFGEDCREFYGTTPTLGNWQGKRL